MINKKVLAERKLINRAIFNEDQREEVLEIEESFFSGERKKIFQDMKFHNDKGQELDLNSLDDSLKTELNKVFPVEIVYKNLLFDTQELLDTTNRVKLEDMCKIANNSNESFELVKERLIENLNNIDDGIEEEKTDLKSLSMSIFDEIDNMDLNDTSIKIGWSNIDERVTFDVGDLIIIAARPAMGKSAYALNMALKLANKGLKGLFFSLEMDKRQIMKRALSSLSGVQLYKIKDKYGQKHLTDKDMGCIGNGVELLNKLDLEIYDKAGISIEKIKSVAKKYNRKKKIDYIVVDYMQLISAQAENRTQEITKISLGLKNLARELEVPVIALSQLSRSVEQRADRKPMMSDLRESGQIEQDASIIQMLYRDEYYNEESEFKGLCEVLTVKNRNGTTGSDYFKFIGEVQRFEEMVR